MRTLTRSKAVAGLTAGLLIAGGGIAQADNIQDTIEDAGTGVSLVAGSTTGGTAAIKVVGNNSDGATTDPGCNWDAGEDPLKLDVVTPEGITATPDPLLVTTCGVDVPVTFKASATAVSGIVTVRIIATPAGGGGYNNQVSIPITVTQPNSKPSVAINGVTTGAEYVIGSVPSATCSVTDLEDGPSSFNAVLSGTLTNGLGSQTATCSFTDAGGLSDTKSVTYTIVSPPNSKPSVVVTGVTNGATYEIGSVPAAGCDVTDAEDGNSTKAAAISGTLSHGLGAQTATCNYTDNGGLAADTATATYTIADTGDPTISHTLSPAAANGSGWFNQDVVVDFTCNDAGSGIQSCTGDTTLGEGANQSATGTATDWAGNTATDAVSGINIDKTPPSVALVGGPAQRGSYYFGSVPAAPTCQGSDALSDIASCTVTGGGATVGIHSYTATATDKAGNTASATHTYSVLAWQLKGFYSPVDMSGVWNTVKGGSTVPLKFEVFAAGEQTSTAAVASFTQKSVTCPSASAVIDEVELVTTGGTSLRYDATAGQYIQNWATPKKPGTCYVVTMTTLDGSKSSANFTLK